MVFFTVACDNTDNEAVYVDTRIEGPAYLNVPNERTLLDPTPFLSQFWIVESLGEFPANYRTSSDAFIDMSETTLPPVFDIQYIPSREGLDDLKMSGSGEFTETSFYSLMDKIHENHSGRIVMLDLRSESHGYLNDTPVYLYGERNWCNLGMGHEEIPAYERDTLNALVGQTVYMHTTAKDSSLWTVSAAMTEDELCGVGGAEYKRIPALDYCFPSDDVIEEFVRYVNNLPTDVWLHFHCKQGKGRTTQFMAFYDMMKNPNVSLKDIVYRQYLIGGLFLFDDGSNETKDWKREFLVEKSTLVPVFYEYVQANWRNNFDISFSEWKKKTYK